MMRVMGFGSFDTTKNKKVNKYLQLMIYQSRIKKSNQNSSLIRNVLQVDGNNTGAVHVLVKRKYRQYMNRKGGFNRPLDYVH